MIAYRAVLMVDMVDLAPREVPLNEKLGITETMWRLQEMSYAVGMNGNCCFVWTKITAIAAPIYNCDLAPSIIIWPAHMPNPLDGQASFTYTTCSALGLKRGERGRGHDAFTARWHAS